MDKIYRRSTKENTALEKRKDDEKKRKRNTIINFRVSPTEKELIDARIKLTGLSKSEFFIMSCMYQNILVKGNIKTLREIKNKMEEISRTINKNPNLEDMEPELRESLRIILEMINNMKI